MNLKEKITEYKNWKKWSNVYKIKALYQLYFIILFITTAVVWIPHYTIVTLTILAVIILAIVLFIMTYNSSPGLSGPIIIATLNVFLIICATSAVNGIDIGRLFLLNCTNIVLIIIVYTTIYFLTQHNKKPETRKLLDKQLEELEQPFDTNKKIEPENTQQSNIEQQNQENTPKKEMHLNGHTQSEKE